MEKQTFKIRVKFVFNGQAIVKAHTRQEAEAIVEEGMVAELGKVFKLDDIVEWSTSSRSHAVVNRKQEDRR